jgi:hypothetical protein
VAVAERFANSESVEGARGVCASKSAGAVELNFSEAVSLNYVVRVELSPDGRVTSVSPVGAW